MAKKDTADDQQTMTILSHLEELRKVIIVSVIAIVVTSIISFVFIEQIMTVLTKPLAEQGINLVVTALTEGIFTKFKIALVAGTILASPIILWQIWQFIVPALYPHERRYLSRLIPISVILFVAGVVFAYTTVFPVAVYILIQLGSEFEPMFTIGKYLSFTLTFLIPFGLIFEFPLVIYFLTSIGVVTPEWLVRNRRYAIVITVILAAVLTPGPDPISQLIMALPMAVLYEAGILVSKVVANKKRKREERAGEEY
ncbi:MAG TPA: twin-arginine translocase subunit TatC [Syntrophomonadaceae bacterium]|nr:twin-arginine translocase subunit TatC [Syntrophomonadaceae bacterium]